jgi:hypothetical protein
MRCAASITAGLLAILAAPSALHAQLRINEVCSSNQGVVEAPGDGTPDWIELVNEGSGPVNLQGFFLSDEEDQPQQWQLPAQTIQPGEHLVMLQGNAPNRFPFGISRDGERLVLSDASLLPLQVMHVPRLRPNHSAGLVNGELRVFDEPTPGEPNSTTAYLGYAPEPMLNPAPGFHPGGVHVSATVPFGQVHWTTSGRMPTQMDEQASTPLGIDTTTILLAQAYALGWLPSEVSSGTYITRAPRGMAAVSIAVDPDSMFHEDLGLYMLGANAEPEWPHYGANFWSDRELEARFELYEPHGTIGLQQDAGLRIHGGRRSRNNPQRPLRLTARGALGPKTFNYRMYPERPSVSDYKRFILRNSGGDFCLSNFRDGLFHQAALHHGLDIDVLGFRPAECFINGRYWGLVEIRERIDADHLHLNYGADKSALLLMEEENIGIQGDTAYSRALREFIRTADMNDDANWRHVEDQLDMRSLTDYFATEMIAGNVDWPSNNVKYWKPSITEGKWRYLMYDLDATMVLYGWIPEDIDMLYWTFTHRAGSFHTELLRGLLRRDEFRRCFLNRKADLMNTVFSPAVLQAEVDHITASYAPVIEHHFARWNCSFGDYQNHAFGIIPHFITYRDAYIRQHVIDWYGFPNAAQLRFEAFPPAAGAVRINTITPELPFEGWYWNGNDIDVTAEPVAGFQFSHWTYDAEEARFTTEHVRRSFASNGNLVAHFKRSDGAMTVFPNPAGDQFSIGFDARDEGFATIRLTDGIGRRVRELSVAVVAGHNRVDIEASSLPAGLYMMEAEANGARQVARLVKE